jgi:hypothetical protein
MKKLAVVFAVVMVMVIALGEFLTPVRGQTSFSNSSLSGTYIFQLTGSDGDLAQLTVTGTLNQSVPISSPPLLNQAQFCVDFGTVCYSININNTILTLPILRPQLIAGQFVADGAGNIASGSGYRFDEGVTSNDGQNYAVQNHSCNFTLTGNYSVLSSGAGTLTINPIGPCINISSATFNLLVGGSKREGVESGVMSLDSPKLNPGGFSTFFVGSFAKQ